MLEKSIPVGRVESSLIPIFYLSIFVSVMACFSSILNLRLSVAVISVWNELHFTTCRLAKKHLGKFNCMVKVRQ